jgi:hypothetical protein
LKAADEALNHIPIGVPPAGRPGFGDSLHAIVARARWGHRENAAFRESKQQLETIVKESGDFKLARYQLAVFLYVQAIARITSPRAAIAPKSARDWRAELEQLLDQAEEHAQHAAADPQFPYAGPLLANIEELRIRLPDPEV